MGVFIAFGDRSRIVDDGGDVGVGVGAGVAAFVERVGCGAVAQHEIVEAAEAPDELPIGGGRCAEAFFDGLPTVGVVRVVIAPSTVEDCFYTAIEAVNIARKYSTPVIILTDQGIATRIEAFIEPDLKSICQDISPDLTPVPDHKPYDLATSDGITRHVPPGTRIASGKYPIVTGLEHDELGHPTGSPKLHIAMTAKRRNKLKRLGADLPVPVPARCRRGPQPR